MLKQIEKLCSSLDELSSQCLNLWSDDRTLREAFGWNCPAITRHDLADMASRLASRIRAADIASLDEYTLSVVADFPRRLDLLKNDTIQYIYNGNAQAAVPAYTETLAAVERLLSPDLDWQEITDNRLIPAKLHRRLRSIQASLDEIVPERQELLASVKLIQDATEAADSLPGDMELLRRARVELEKSSTATAGVVIKIEENRKSSEASLGKLRESSKEAEKLILQCQEAYRITTTTGLAASFDARARSLGFSMLAWVVGLLLALGIGSYIGSIRVHELTVALKDNPHWGIVAIHILLSVFSVGAPIWFAWLATKQIGQRFRLAEDYSFKASVAKAYEGYRREAARIDKAFEARLFGSALTRLEEAPLRLVEEDAHGSPWHELVSSKAFQTALDKVPSLRQKMLDITVNRKSDAAAAESDQSLGTGSPG